MHKNVIAICVIVVLLPFSVFKSSVVANALQEQRAKRGDLIIIPADRNTDTYAIENNRGFNLGFNAGQQFIGGLGISGYGRNPKTGVFENWAGGGNAWGGLPYGAGLGINFGRPEVINLSKATNDNNNVDLVRQQQPS